MATTVKPAASSAAARRRQPAEDAPSVNGDTALSPAELEALLEALRAAARGERGLRLDGRRRGIGGEIARAFNQLSQTRESTTDEIVRVSRAIGREGKLTERAQVSA